MRTKIVWVGTAILVLSACQQAPAAADAAGIETILRDNEVRWNRAYAQHDARALAAFYADDAALANPGTALATGAQAIRRETAAFAADPALQVQFANDRIQVAASGDLAYTRGHYTMTMTDAATGQPSASGGSYLTVWRKQADGGWKAVEDFVTPGPAAQSATSASSSPH